MNLSPYTVLVQSECEHKNPHVHPNEHMYDIHMPHRHITIPHALQRLGMYFFLHAFHMNIILGKNSFPGFDVSW